MKKFAVCLMVLGLLFALSPPATASDYENVEMPNIPVIIPLAAACIEIVKLSSSPVSHIVDQAINDYRGYPLSLIGEAANAVINTGLDIYQACMPQEWALNRDLLAPVQASVYNGGMVKMIKLE